MFTRPVPLSWASQYIIILILKSILKFVIGLLTPVERVRVAEGDPEVAARNSLLLHQVTRRFFLKLVLRLFPRKHATSQQLEQFLGV